mmetsp:Transcript_10262/g.13572  ORF Transcript_10262/g.13572 Transcript_10262/m.13572 type:complete len:94 (-) Transcript_10262:170-451(-)
MQTRPRLRGLAFRVMEPPRPGPHSTGAGLAVAEPGLRRARAGGPPAGAEAEDRKLRAFAATLAQLRAGEGTFWGAVMGVYLPLMRAPCRGRDA